MTLLLLYTSEAGLKVIPVEQRSHQTRLTSTVHYLYVSTDSVTVFFQLLYLKYKGFSLNEDQLTDRQGHNASVYIDRYSSSSYSEWLKGQIMTLMTPTAGCLFLQLHNSKLLHLKSSKCICYANV